MQNIELTGQKLRPEQVTLLAQGGTQAHIATAALERATEAADAAERIAARQPVYGRTTGVGANRTQHVEEGDLTHGMRLLRSHAGGIGRVVPRTATRAMLAVRANQLLAGGAGLRPEIIEAIVGALNADELPEIHEYGGIGTADLTALAELGLALVGERPWIAADQASADAAADERPGSGGGPAPVRITSGDALALISSSALTIGRACLAWDEARRWIRAAHGVAVLSFFALEGSPEPYSRTVHESRPHEAQQRSAALLRALLAGQGLKAARIQDPYALRSIPQVHGAAMHALDSVAQVLSVELNAAAENPLVSARDEAVYHHGGFHQAMLTQSLDALNLALLAVGHLSLARVNMMFHPEFTGLRPFLADGEPASSGVMILENAAHDALSEMRNAAMPAGLGHATLSRGVEDHSPFTSQSRRQTARSVDALQLVLGTELVSAMRTLRLRGQTPTPGTTLADLYTLAEVLDPGTADRATTPDVHHAARLLPSIADAVEEAERA
ncbi:MAG: aromatic amino acid ammonia-lyase [Actinocrinis sp.]